MIKDNNLNSSAANEHLDDTSQSAEKTSFYEELQFALNKRNAKGNINEKQRNKNIEELKKNIKTAKKMDPQYRNSMIQYLITVIVKHPKKDSKDRIRELYIDGIYFLDESKDTLNEENLKILNDCIEFKETSDKKVSQSKCLPMTANNNYKNKNIDNIFKFIKNEKLINFLGTKKDKDRSEERSHTEAMIMREKIQKHFGLTDEDFTKDIQKKFGVTEEDFSKESDEINKKFDLTDEDFTKDGDIQKKFGVTEEDFSKESDEINKKFDLKLEDCSKKSDEINTDIKRGDKFNEMIKDLNFIIKLKNVFGEKEIKYLIKKECARYNSSQANLVHKAIISAATNNDNNMEYVNSNDNQPGLDAHARTSGISRHELDKAKAQAETKVVSRSSSIKSTNAFKITNPKTSAIEKKDTSNEVRESNDEKQKELSKNTVSKYYTGTALKIQAPVQPTGRFTSNANDTVNKHKPNKCTVPNLIVDEEGQNSNLILKNLGDLDAITQVENPNSQNALPGSFQRS